MVELNYLMYVIFPFLIKKTQLYFLIHVHAHVAEPPVQILTCSFWNTCFLENLALVDTGPGEASREAEKPAKEKVKRLIP